MSTMCCVPFAVPSVDHNAAPPVGGDVVKSTREPKRTKFDGYDDANWFVPVVLMSLTRYGVCAIKGQQMLSKRTAMTVRMRRAPVRRSTGILAAIVFLLRPLLKAAGNQPATATTMHAP